MVKKLDTKSLFGKSHQAGFRIFQDFFLYLLTITGFNVIREEFFSGHRNRIQLIVMFLLPTLGSVSAVLVVCRYPKDIEEVIMGTITLMIQFQGLAKMIELVLNREAHSKMIKTVVDDTEKLHRGSDSVHSIGVKNYRRAQFYTKLATVSYLGALASLQLYPIYALLIKKELKLAATMELPGTNHKEALGFLINYLYCSVVTPSLCMVILAYDILFYMYVFNITGKFQVLEEKVVMVGNFESFYDTDEKQHELIVECVRIHAEVVEFTQKCSKMFSPVFFFICLSDLLIICISVFHLSLDIYASSSFMLIAGLVQCSILCNCGEIVKTGSENFMRAIYGSQWYRLKRIDQRKMILHMLMQSQNDIGFKAGGATVCLGLHMIVSWKTLNALNDFY